MSIIITIITEALRIWGVATAPIHELGHVIFGWLSLNPAIIVNWNTSAAMRDGFIFRLGGYLFEAILPAILAYKFRKHTLIHPIAGFSVTSMLYCLQAQTDFTYSATGPIMIWWLAGILAYVTILYSYVLSREEKHNARNKRAGHKRQGVFVAKLEPGNAQV